VTEDEIRTFIMESISDIAPDAEWDDVDPKQSLRDELDLDSMDFLALVRAIHERLEVDVPESDYAKIDSLDGCAAYLRDALG